MVTEVSIVYGPAHPLWPLQRPQPFDMRLLNIYFVLTSNSEYNKDKRLCLLNCSLIWHALQPSISLKLSGPAHPLWPLQVTILCVRFTQVVFTRPIGQRHDLVTPLRRPSLDQNGNANGHDHRRKNISVAILAHILLNFAQHYFCLSFYW